MWALMQEWIDGNGPPLELRSVQIQRIPCKRCSSPRAPSSKAHPVAVNWSADCRAAFAKALLIAQKLRDQPAHREAAHWKALCHVLAREIPLTSTSPIVVTAVEQSINNWPPKRAGSVRDALHGQPAAPVVDFVHMVTRGFPYLLAGRQLHAGVAAAPTVGIKSYQPTDSTDEFNPERVKIIQEEERRMGEALDDWLGHLRLLAQNTDIRFRAAAGRLVACGPEILRDWSLLRDLDPDNCDKTVHGIMAVIAQATWAPSVFDAFIADLFPRVLPNTWARVLGLTPDAMKSNLSRGQRDLEALLSWAPDPALVKATRAIGAYRRKEANVKTIGGALKNTAANDLLAPTLAPAPKGGSSP